MNRTKIQMVHLIINTKTSDNTHIFLFFSFKVLVVPLVKPKIDIGSTFWCVSHFVM